MSAHNLATAWAAGLDTLKTVVDSTTKLVIAQLGDVLAEQSDSDDAEVWQQWGFVSRPPKPDAKKAAAQCVALRGGDRDVVVAGRDQRGVELAGNLQDGETCVYAAGDDGKGQARILLKNGSVAIYTTEGNVEGGPSVVIQVTKEGAVALASQYGAITLDSNGIKAGTSGGAGFQFGVDGKVAIIGTEIALNAGSVSLGANATNPVLWGPSGPLGTASLSVKVAL